MRWRILALLFFARIGLGFQFQTVASVGDELVLAFGLDYATIGFLIGLFMAPGLILALPAGFLGRLVPDRQLVGFGLAALAIGGLLSSLASNSWGVGLGRIIAGAGFLFSNLYCTKMVADWFDGKEIATAMSVLVMSWPLGIAMGQVGHAWVAEIYGWRLPFQIASLYCFVAAVSILCFYRQPQVAVPVQTAVAPRLNSQEWQLILCAGGSWALFNAAYVVYLSFGPMVLEGLGQSNLGAATTISVGSWVMAASAILCGFIVDRFGHRYLVIIVCLLGGMGGLSMLGVPGAGLAASVLFGFLGIAPAGVIMALAGMALRPEVRAFGMGVFFTVYFAIMWAVPPMAGALLDATGRSMAPILLAIVLLASVIPLVLAFKGIKSRHTTVSETLQPQ